MGTPPLSRETCLQAVEAMNQAIRAGKSYDYAGELIGIGGGTLYKRLRIAKRLYGLEPKEQKSKPGPVPVVEARQRVRIKAWRKPDDLPVTRVLGIGDLHDGPELADKSRLRWLGRHAAETRPDHVVFIGDIADFDSLSRHAQPGSMADKVRPSYARDLESLDEALSVFRKELPTGQGPVVHTTEGNHEGRIYRWEENSAAAAGMLVGPLQDIYARHDMRRYPEGEYLMIAGVGFVHCPRTLMNKEFGGKWLNSIANDSIVSTVFGHSHRGQVLHAHKCGPFGGITLVNLGTALPMGYIKQYAKVASSSWTWGCYDIAIQGGHIIGHTFHSMQDLERRYA